MKIEWLPTAEYDLDSQIAYIAERNPRAAIQAGDSVEASIARLADFLQGARLGRVVGTRELVVSGTPFVVVYRVEPDAVAILRVLHGAQLWPGDL